MKLPFKQLRVRELLADNGATVRDLSAKLSPPQYEGGPPVGYHEESVDKTLRDEMGTEKFIKHVAYFAGCDWEALVDIVPFSKSAKTEELCKRLKGLWHMYHYTARSHVRDIVPTETRLTIKADGSCTLVYPDPDPKVDPADWITFEGSLYAEESGRFVLVLDSKWAGHDEKLVVRGKCPPEKKPLSLHAAWLGVDFDENPRCSQVILVREPVASMDAGGMIKGQKSPWLSPDAVNDVMLNKWDGLLLKDQLNALRLSDTVNFFTTGFPHSDFSVISEALNAFVETRKNLPLPAEHRLKIKILMLHYDATEIIKARTSLQSTKTEFRRDSINQLVLLLAQSRREFEGLIELDLRLYYTWPWGHYCNISDRITLYAPLFADEWADTAPSIVSWDPRSALWRKASFNFEKTFRRAVPVDISALKTAAASEGVEWLMD